DSDGGVEAVGHGRRAVVRADVLGLAGTAVDELPLLPREPELVVDSIEVRCLERDDARVERAAGQTRQDGVGHDSSVSASAYARRRPKRGRAAGVVTPAAWLVRRPGPRVLPPITPASTPADCSRRVLPPGAARE